MKNVYVIIILLLSINIYAQSPGNIGNNANLRLWIKAGAGTTGTSPITDWDSQTTSYTLSLEDGTDGPTLETNAVNFNPAVTFDGTDDTMSITGGIVGTDEIRKNTIFVVSKASEIKNSFLLYENQPIEDTQFSLNIPWGGSQVIYDLGTTPTTSRIINDWGGDLDQYYLWTLTSSDDGSGTVSGGHKSIHRNGALVLSNAQSDFITGENGDFFLGGKNATDNLFNGSIAEMIILDDLPNTAQQRRVHSYFAIRYGITLESTGSGDTDSSYRLSSNSEIVWSAANTAYHNDIAVIAKDDTSDYEQLKSKSINSGAVLTIEKSGSFSSDYDAVAVGNNGEDVTTTTEGADATYNTRLRRVWYTQVNGTPGNISVSFNLGGSIENTGVLADYALLRDTDTDFSDGTVVTTNVTLVGNVLTFSNLSFATGDLFTLGINADVPYPGGIDTNFKLWYRADAELEATGTDVTTWGSYYSSDFDFTYNASYNEPTLNTSGINYNSSIDFGGDSNKTEFILDAANLDIRTVFIVYNHVDNNKYETPFTNDLDLFHGDDDGTVYNETGEAVAETADKAKLGTSYVNGLSTDLLLHPVPLKTEIHTRELTANENASTKYYIGSNKSNVQRYYEGQISEIIIYDGTLTAPFRDNVESYLAIKYGVTLDNSGGGTAGDVVDSDNNIIWDASDNSDYHNQLAVIGLDKGSGLNQKQSRSESANSVLSISLGTTVETTNTDNTNTFNSDLDFFAVGSNAVATDVLDINCSTNLYKVNRDWKIQKTGFTGAETITLQFNMSGIDKPGGFELLIDTDGDFTTTGDQTTNTGGSLSGNNLTFSAIDIDDLPSGAVFTLVRKAGYDLVYDGSWSGDAPDTSDGDNRVVIQSNLTIGASFVCDCLKIDSGVVLTIGDTDYVDTDELILNGDLYLEGDAELIQVESTDLNSGTGQVYKIINDATSSGYRFNYLSSPVNTSGTYSLSGNLKFNTGANLGVNTDPSFIDNDSDGFGTTISSAWLYTLNSSGTYTKIDEDTDLDPGVGFTMKGTNQANDYNFIGSPNNGDIDALTLVTDEYAIVGNPYPSAIDADTFNDAMGTITDGVIYFWDQPTGDSHYQEDYEGGYATWTSTVGVPASGVGAMSDGTTIPSGVIKPGQGFVVTGGTTGGNIVFTNSMRISNTSSSGEKLFKTSKTSSLIPVIRLGFEFETEKGTYHRQLVTTPNGGTLTHDQGKDAKMFDDKKNDAYWLVNNEDDRYVITSVPVVNDDLNLDLGVVLEEEKEVTFTLDDAELFSKDIYLLDKELNNITDIRATDYTTQVSQGTNTDRFSLVFKENVTLGNEYIDANSKTVIYVEESDIHIVLEKGDVKNVKLYDLSGKELINYNNTSSETSIQIATKNINNQLVVIKVNTSHGMFTKKIFLE